MGINILNKARNGVDVDGVRQVAGESHDNRDIGMVAFTGQGEGVDVDDDFAHLGQQAARDQVVSELLPAFIGPTVCSQYNFPFPKKPTWQPDEQLLGNSFPPTLY